MPQLRHSIKGLLFLSSYLPLFATLAFKSRTVTSTYFGVTAPFLSGFFLLLCVVPVSILFPVLRFQSTSNTDMKEIDEYRRRNDQITSYLLVYVFGYLSLEFFNLTSIIAFTIFFGTVAIIQVRSAQLHVNPVLGMIGYDIYRIKSGRDVSLVVTNADLEAELLPPEDADGVPDPTADERYLKVAELGNNVYITQNNGRAS